MFASTRIASQLPLAAIVSLLSGFAPTLCTAVPSRAEVFREVWQTVKDNFFDPNLRGVDWDAMRQRYGKEAEGADSVDEFSAVVNRMLSELKTSHTRFYTQEEPEYYQLAGIFCRVRRGAELRRALLIQIGREMAASSPKKIQAVGPKVAAENK